MSLNWSWSEKVGELTADVEVRENGAIVQKEHTFSLYQGNAFLIILNEWEEDGVEKYSLYSFFAGEDHAKNMFGMNKKQGYTDNIVARWGWKKIRLNKKKYSYTQKLVDLLVKGLDNIDIEIYSEA